jgi:hypothetical protein
MSKTNKCTRVDELRRKLKKLLNIKRTEEPRRRSSRICFDIDKGQGRQGDVEEEEEEEEEGELELDTRRRLAE